ncbi:MAG: DUF2782 domain-containing protein [Candidatus Nitricoxidivorans perseverans]|uniref:DUF2782 domain-containing protein n=1 Tax=Candidatus Nitricoxidivorans perseverans TaxID=2975601 RepID=A0AA49ITE3_9PROT|nr:MAG: DUF2782 domain-containing protein [Candidatus Nitricoxidivorans perseverans]
MRRLIPMLMMAAALPVSAQSRPTDLQPVPEPPSPPGLLEPSLEPQVTITKRGQDKAEEYRINGKLYMIKVTPPNGVPYYLIDSRGDGTWARQESLDTGLRVPHWVVGTF